MLTAPMTIFERAAITASACWRRSIAEAISGAYARCVSRASSTTHAGLREPTAELVLQLLRDFVAAAAQRDLVLLAVVVRVRARDAADRRLALHLHVAFVVLDVERGLRRVVDAPDDHGRDLDRVAALVVDLELLAVEVVRAQRDLGRQRLVDDAA